MAKRGQNETTQEPVAGAPAENEAAPAAIVEAPQPEVPVDLPPCAGCERRLSPDDVDEGLEFCAVCEGEKKETADEEAAEVPLVLPEKPFPAAVEEAMKAFGLKREHVHPGTETKLGLQPGYSVVLKTLGRIVTVVTQGGKRVRMITLPNGTVAYMGVKTTFVYPRQDKKGGVVTYNDVAWIKSNAGGIVARDDHGRGTLVKNADGGVLRAESPAALVHDRDRGITVDPPAESKSYRAK